MKKDRVKGFDEAMERAIEDALAPIRFAVGSDVFTQFELAGLMGRSPSTLSDILRWREKNVAPHPDKVRMVCRQFDKACRKNKRLREVMRDYEVGGAGK